MNWLHGILCICIVFCVVLYLPIAKNESNTKTGTERNVFDQHLKKYDVVDQQMKEYDVVDQQMKENDTGVLSIQTVRRPMDIMADRDITCPLCTVYNLTAPSELNCSCVKMHVGHPTPICLYSSKKDTYISRTFRVNRTFEGAFLQVAMQQLEINSSLGLIDIGSNIGTYTLAVAALGHDVLSVEPNLWNARRIHKAVMLGGLESRVTLLLNAISDDRGVSKLVYSSVNQGRTLTEKVEIVPGETYDNQSVYAKSITLNDLVPFCRFKQAIMKIDIEGFEGKAFQRADILFTSIHIPYIQMEWKYAAKLRMSSGGNQEYPMIIRLMEFLEKRKYEPVHIVGEKPLNITKWQKWPSDIAWMKR